MFADTVSSKLNMLKVVGFKSNHKTCLPAFTSFRNIILIVSRLAACIDIVGIHSQKTGIFKAGWDFLICFFAFTYSRVFCLFPDNVVKVWRIFPNTQESMSLLMSFYCAHTPLHMNISGTRLAVAFQQLATATYTTVVYDLETKSELQITQLQDSARENT